MWRHSQMVLDDTGCSSLPIGCWRRFLTCFFNSEVTVKCLKPKPHLWNKHYRLRVTAVLRINHDPNHICSVVLQWGAAPMMDMDRLEEWQYFVSSTTATLALCGMWSLFKKQNILHRALQGSTGVMSRWEHSPFLFLIIQTAPFPFDICRRRKLNCFNALLINTIVPELLGCNSLHCSAVKFRVSPSSPTCHSQRHFCVS